MIREARKKHLRLVFYQKIPIDENSSHYGRPGLNQFIAIEDLLAQAHCSIASGLDLQHVLLKQGLQLLTIDFMQSFESPFQDGL